MNGFSAGTLLLSCLTSAFSVGGNTASPGPVMEGVRGIHRGFPEASAAHDWGSRGKSIDSMKEGKFNVRSKLRAAGGLR